jgi:predicted homoserine dehydrogenase-like protein
VSPSGGPVCEVVSVAKRDLARGEVLDGIGGFSSYGVIENAPAARAENLVPIGLSGGCRLRRDVARDVALSYEDVDVPEGRLADALFAEQVETFRAPAGA